MLEAGRDRLLDSGFAGNLHCLVADAERLPFGDDCFDCVTIGFGLRNVTDKAAALSSMRRVLKPGGQLLVLEFSKPVAPGLKPFYDAYSFNVLPALGRLDCQGCRELSLSGGVDPHASRSGNPAPTCSRTPDSARLDTTISPAASSPCTAATRSDMPATPVWLAAVESLLNRSIDGSIKAAAAAGGLNRTSLRIDIEGLSSIRAAVAAGRLALAAGDGAQADAVISGSPVLTAELLASGAAAQRGGRSRTPRACRRGSRGDAEVAARYRELFALARPDWEEELSRLVGDLPARRLSRSPRAGRSRGPQGSGARPARTSRSI